MMGARNMSVMTGDTTECFAAEGAAHAVCRDGSGSDGGGSSSGGGCCCCDGSGSERVVMVVMVWMKEITGMGVQR